MSEKHTREETKEESNKKAKTVPSTCKECTVNKEGYEILCYDCYLKINSQTELYKNRLEKWNVKGDIKQLCNELFTCINSENYGISDLLYSFDESSQDFYLDIVKILEKYNISSKK